MQKDSDRKKEILAFGRSTLAGLEFLLSNFLARPVVVLQILTLFIAGRASETSDLSVILFRYLKTKSLLFQRDLGHFQKPRKCSVQAH
jgi:hypothetical protein